MNKKAKRFILVILDGWGLIKNEKVSAIEKARTPFFDSLMLKYPNSTLITHGLEVGLPDGQMGNSEVGSYEFRRWANRVSRTGKNK